MTAKEFLIRKRTYKDVPHEMECALVEGWMEDYAKHIIEDVLCDDSPINFDELTISNLIEMHQNVTALVNWAITPNSPIIIVRR